MAAPVPAVDRTKLVLDVLASDPRHPYRAAEVAKLTAIHRASCFSLLNALSEAGFVTRDPDGPRYTLGPLLIAYGAKSASSHGPFDEARREMFRLADMLDCGGIVSARAGYEMVTLDSIGVDDEQFPGDRAPLRAPRGTIFLAWSPQSELDEWLEWSGVSNAEHRAVVRTAAAIRARGYSLGADVELGLSLERIARQLSDSPDPRVVDEVLHDITNLLRRSGQAAVDGRPVDESVRRLSAPIFDHRGQVVLTVTMVAQGAPFADDTVQMLAGQLVESTDRLSDRRPATTSP